MTTPSTKAKASRSPLPSGVEDLGEITPAFSEILTPEALAFVAKLQRQFGTRRKQCLEHRQERQRRLNQGEGLDFLPETKQIREGDWKCAPIPSDIQDRRVEITGPTDRKMVINALNSGAKIFMADFEDANAPTWRNMVEGQINLRDAIRGTINFTNPEGKKYKLNEQVAVLMPRPRGWHLLEKQVLIETIPAAFEMDEILYELRDHSSGLNCGRWDYIFSCIKRFRNKRDFLLADRALITMTTHFMHSYSLLCIKTCHRRATFAMGGMAAQIPVKNDPKANEEAFAKVRADKERERAMATMVPGSLIREWSSSQWMLLMP